MEAEGHKICILTQYNINIRTCRGVNPWSWFAGGFQVAKEGKRAFVESGGVDAACLLGGATQIREGCGVESRRAKWNLRVPRQYISECQILGTSGPGRCPDVLLGSCFNRYSCAGGKEAPVGCGLLAERLLS